MKLYEINEAINELVNQLEIDGETGEVSESAEEIMEQLHQLNMERDSVLQYLAKVVLNNRAEQDMLKKEEHRLKERRDRLAHKEARLINVLDRECGGVTTPLGVATLSYRKTSRVIVQDPDQAVSWLRDHDHEDCYHVPMPEVSKSEVKKLLNAGIDVPGCMIDSGQSCSLR